MAPRKSTKIPAELNPEPVVAAPKAKVAAKAPARPRAKKADVEVEAAAPVAAVEAPAPKPARKPKTLAKTPAKAAQKAPAEPVAAPVPPEPAASPVPSAPIQLSVQTQAVLQAIQDGRAVELIFSDADSNPPRTFEPRQLVFDVFAKDWYVWGWDRRYNAERHHRLNLIAEVNEVEGMGRAAQGPYKDGTPANQIGGWLGGEAIRVKAVLLKQWIFAVRQAPAPFPEFKIEDLEEGKAQVSFTATDLRAIARWVMQFGDGIQIQEPQRLIDRVKQVGVTWGGKPAAQAQAPAPKAIQPPRPERTERPERPERPEREHREHKEAHRHEHREAKPERRPDAPRHGQEPTKPKSAKIEIRIDRL
jgi:predicted DNA-binding transcriptional regulator YafY